MLGKLSRASHLPTGSTRPSPQPAFPWARPHLVSSPVSSRRSPQLRSQTHLQAYSAPEVPPEVGVLPETPPASSAHTKEAKPSISRISPTDQAIAVAGLGAAVAFVWAGSGAVSPVLDPLRPVVLCYMLSSGFEYAFHRYSMHGKPQSWGASVSGGRNRVHLDHHAETVADRKASLDMSLPEGYDADALYFHTPSTLASVVGLGVTMTALNSIGDLGMSMPGIWITALLSALFHHMAWNTLHADSHYVEIDIKDGLPALRKPYPFSDTAVAAWLLRNHTIHHTVRGTGNFNIVLPIMDHATGTYYYLDNKA